MKYNQLMGLFNYLLRHKRKPSKGENTSENENEIIQIKEDVSESDYLKELNKSNAIIKKRLLIKSRIYKEKLDAKYKDKLEAFNKRIELLNKSEALTSLNYIMNNTQYWSSWVLNKKDFTPPSGLESIISFPQHNNEIKVFETWVSLFERVIESELKLDSIIELTNHNLQFKTYSEDYSKGMVEILSDGNVVFEAEYYTSDHYEVTRFHLSSIHILKEIDWISPFIEFKLNLESALANEKYKQDVSINEFLIKKNIN